MMRTRNKPALIFFCLLLSAAAVLSGVNIYSELRQQQTTSILIMISVSIEIADQLDSLMIMRNHKGFLN